MKKTVLVSAVFVCGCLVRVDPSQSPLAAGSRILGVSMSSSWDFREGYNSVGADVRPELGFLFSDNVALLFMPFYAADVQEGKLDWQTAGLLIAGDYTFYSPGKNMHPFVSGHIGFAAAWVEDKVASKTDEGQGFVLGGGGGLRTFHSSHCSIDLAARFTLTTLKLTNIAVSLPSDLWVGFSVKLYFPVRRSLQTR